ncbi:hypothetical protein VUR80DRAFT_3816 [Thermomyces stellatus]
MASSMLRPLRATTGAVRLYHGVLSGPQLGPRTSPQPTTRLRPALWAQSPLISRAYASSRGPSSHYERMRAQLEPDPEPEPALKPPESSPKDTPTETPPESPQPAKSEPDSSTSPEPPPNPDPGLPSAADSRRTPLAARFSSFMDNLQDRYVSGLQAFNSLTGYSSIEAITANNVRLEKTLGEARKTMRAARQHLQETSARQVSTQRDMATLLARKASWVQSDKARFAELIEDDYRLETEVAQAARNVEDAEAREQALTSEWVAGMSKQYYEHQVYSDRIRRASTWGTWGLMGVNVLLFLLLQFVAEPWKRGRLLNSMEEREAKLLDRMEEGLGSMREEMRGSIAALKPAETEDRVAEVEAAPRTWEWREALQDPWLIWGLVTDGYGALREELQLKDMIAIGIQLIILLKSFC